MTHLPTLLLCAVVIFGFYLLIDGLIYLVGLIVVVMFILSFLGLH